MLPQSSMAVKVYVCEWTHPFTTRVPREDVTVGIEQESTATAIPAAGTESVWLQPRNADAGQDVNTGGVWSYV